MSATLLAATVLFLAGLLAGFVAGLLTECARIRAAERALCAPEPGGPR